MRLELHPEARLEFLDAVSHYESCHSGLGERFIQSIESALASIGESPEAWAEIEQDVRRKRTRTPTKQKPDRFCVVHQDHHKSKCYVAWMQRKRNPGIFSPRHQLLNRRSYFSDTAFARFHLDRSGCEVNFYESVSDPKLLCSPSNHRRSVKCTIARPASIRAGSVDSAIIKLWERRCAARLILHRSPQPTANRRVM